MRSRVNKPSKIWLRFLRWYCHPGYVEDLEGDLLERFERRMEEKSPRSAKWGFVKDVIRLCRPGIIRPLFQGKYKQLYMLKTNFKLGLRNLIKRKEHTLINIFGLSLGLASALLILIYTQYEHSYDKSYGDSELTFKMIQEVTTPESIKKYAPVPYALIDIMVNDYPEVKRGTALAGPYDSQLLFYEDDKGERIKTLENGVVLADSNFFKVFDLKVLKGNPAHALKAPNSVVLTESAALRFFGKIDVVGRSIAPTGKNSTVTAVCEDPPGNSHLSFNYLVSSTSVKWLSNEKFSLSSAHCYFKLQDKAAAHTLNQKLQELVSKYVLKEMAKTRQTSTDTYLEAGNNIEYSLIPLESIYLHPDNPGGFKAGGSSITIQILSIVAYLILGIAIINFINLTTAQANERAKEVGIRKVLGSRKRQLIIQFLTESLIITLLSFLLALTIVKLGLPYYTNLTGKPLSLELDPSFLSTFLLLAVLVAFISGTYPSFILSSIRPVDSLKGKILLSPKGIQFRNGLSILQFLIAIVLINCTIIINDQVDYLKNKDLGFDKDEVVVIEGTFHSNPTYSKPFLDKLRSLPFIKEAAGTLWVQGFQSLWSDKYYVNGSSEIVKLNRTMIGDGYAEALNFRLLEGELFSEQTNDSLAVLLNESAARKLGLTKPVGKTVRLAEGTDRFTELKIKGIVKDFNYNTLHHTIEPLVIRSNESNYGRMKYIVAKLDKSSDASHITQIEQVWNETINDRPFNFRFLDDTIDAKYRSELQTARVLLIFTMLTVFIACLSLYSLSSYIINLRMKEFGVRKIFGAHGFDIIQILLKDFIRTGTVAFVLGLPLTWWVGMEWLQNFAYHIDIEATAFSLSASIVLAVILLTVGKSVIQAANKNAIETLKNE